MQSEKYLLGHRIAKEQALYLDARRKRRSLLGLDSGFGGQSGWLPESYAA
jgi:hypothetical protein